MELHNNIRDYRRKAGLTQEQLAEAMGVTGASVSKWENGQSAPDLTALPLQSDCFLNSLFRLFQDVNDFSEIWLYKGEKALAAVEWGSRAMESVTDSPE